MSTTTPKTTTTPKRTATAGAVIAGRVYFAMQAVGGALWWIAVFQLPLVREETLGSLNPVIVAAFDLPLFVLASALAAAGVRVFRWVALGWTVLVTIGMAGYATLTTEAGWGALLMIAAAGGSALSAALMTLGRLPTDWIVRGPFAFRPASPSSRLALIARAGLQIAFFWGLFLLAIPLIIVVLERRWQLEIALPPLLVLSGIPLLILASPLGLWSASVFVKHGDGTPLPSAMPAKLVIAGPYRFVRNPMAVAGIAQGAAVGLILGSWLVVAYALIGSLIWNWMVRPHEEADLSARFGAEYTRYRRHVRCWIPRFRPWQDTTAREESPEDALTQ